MPHDPFDVWADMAIKIWPENYWLVGLAPGSLPVAARALEDSTSRYACIIQDQTGFSVVVDETVFGGMKDSPAVRASFGPLKVISTDSPLPFDVVGFIQAALREVNGAGYKAAPQCGAAADHFFTGAADIEMVEAQFRRLISDARARRR
ncbi:hypothetical protein VQH23_12670 [Pararoseomonas sp. SCSIO 73927]|uniref:hypothetical protein n=1 Tax=Pararoseomonas sp. SCSIO 73927 TaxID=3114537 RepID=UPI0030D42419